MKAELLELNKLVKSKEDEWVTVRGCLTKQEVEDKNSLIVSPETYVLRDHEETIRRERDTLWDKQRKMIAKMSITMALELHEHECPWISELHQKYVVEQVALADLSQDMRAAFYDYVNIYGSEFR